MKTKAAKNLRIGDRFPATTHYDRALPRVVLSWNLSSMLDEDWTEVLAVECLQNFVRITKTLSPGERAAGYGPEVLLSPGDEVPQ